MKLSIIKKRIIEIANRIKFLPSNFKAKTYEVSNNKLRTKKALPSFVLYRKEKNSLGLMEYNRKERERIELNRITLRDVEVAEIKKRI